MSNRKRQERKRREAERKQAERETKEKHKERTKRDQSREGGDYRDRLSWWHRLLRGERKPRKKRLQQTDVDAVDISRPQDTAPEPVDDNEVWLDKLAEQVGEGRRLDDVGNDEFWEHIAKLWADQRELRAIEWITKFISAPAIDEPRALPLRVHLVDYLTRRNELEQARPQLEILTAYPDHRLQAHYLLADYHRQSGDAVSAIRHLELVVASDIEYENAWSRLMRLRAKRGLTRTASLSDTMAGPSGADDGRFHLLEELGRGGTGVVYRALDSQLDRDVAIKLLHPHLAAAEQKSACSRFFDEARVATSLRSPHILAILDINGNARRLVMELASGGSLADKLRQAPCPPLRALSYHRQVLAALVAAHERGIVHRDVKPDNILFRRAGDAAYDDVALADFGAAHLPSADQKPQDDTMVGTVAYMSPEQRRGEITSRADVYSAGVVLFESLTGKSPWSQRDMLASTRTDEDLLLPAGVITDATLGDAINGYLRAVGRTDPEQRLDSAQSRTIADRLYAMARTLEAD